MIILFLTIHYIGWRVFLGRTPELHEALGLGIVATSILLVDLFGKKIQENEDDQE